MFRYLVLCAVCLAVACVFQSSPAGADATTISYQGVLSDYEGVALSDEPREMQFALWDAQVEGAVLWQEVQPGVFVTNGAFSVELGSSAPFPSDLFSAHSALWLEVTVDTGSGMRTFSPRVALCAAPYALHAAAADTVANVAPQTVRKFAVAPGDSVAPGDVLFLLDEEVHKGVACSATVFNAAQTSNFAAAGLTRNQGLIAYRDEGQGGAGIIKGVGIMGDDTLGYGVPATFNAAMTGSTALAALTSSECALAYAGNGGAGNLRLVTAGISGGGAPTVFLGSPYVFNAGNTWYIAVGRVSEMQYVIAYRDVTSGRGMAVAGNTGGVFSTPVLFGTGAVSYVSVGGFPDGGCVITYRDEAASGVGTAVVGRVTDSGGTPVLTLGSPMVFSAEPTWYTSVATFLTDRGVIAARSGPSAPNPAVATPFTVSGLSITLYEPVIFGQTGFSSVFVASVTDSRFVAVDVTDTEGVASQIGTFPLSSPSWGISFTSRRVISPVGTTYPMLTGLPGAGYLFASMLDNTNFYGAALFGDAGFPIGIADGEAAGGASVPVVIQGVSDRFTWLQPGIPYFHQAGHLAKHSGWGRIGIALSSTELLLDMER